MEGREAVVLELTNAQFDRFMTLLYFLTLKQKQDYIKSDDLLCFYICQTIHFIIISRSTLPLSFTNLSEMESTFLLVPSKDLPL